MKDENGVDFEYCIVGNIIGNHYWGEDKKIVSGTKYFSAETKVYCVFMFNGEGHEHIRVLGKKRKSFRMIDVVVRARYIKNRRLIKVYTPRILDYIRKYPRYIMTLEDAQYYVDAGFNVEISEEGETNSPTENNL